MSRLAQTPGCFLVEWYQAELSPEPCERTAAVLNATAESMTAQGWPIELLSMLAVPSDESLFAVFTASSATVVAETCDRAGMPAQRLTVAADIWCRAPTGQETHDLSDTPTQDLLRGTR